MTFRQALFLLCIATGLVGLSCDPVDDSRPPTCEAVGAHLSDVCMSSSFGEGVRLDCQVFGLSSAVRRCLVAVTQCGAPVTACGVTNIVVTCATTVDCPTPLVCETAVQECVECSAELPCPTGKSCFGGVCATGP